MLGIRAEYPPQRVDRILVRRDGPNQRAPHGFVPFAVVRSTYASDPRGYFGPGHVIDHRHNSVGWRSGEHALAKPPRTYRILGLGDSYLWGQGVRREDGVLSRLGALLAGAAGGRRIETINAAMSGTNTREQRDLLRERGLAYDPDLVVLHFVPNDVEEDLSGDAPKIEFFRNYTSIYLSPDPLSEVSRLWGWVRQRALLAVRARRYVRESLESFRSDSAKWARCREALDDIQRLAADRGVPLLVVIFPFFHELDGDYPFQEIHDVVRAHCESRGIPVLDLREHFRAFRGPELWVHPTDQHPNERAHEIAARAIAEHLERRPEIFGLR